MHLTSWADSSPFPHPIDIVYLWVDGTDPEWLAIKENYLALRKNKAADAFDAYSDNRFADHDELRYSLRSIWEYAPFFNHIYIVTMNQRPRWLADHPKITIIDHRQIFKNINDLPTFNSQAIESNLHRIPGLTEYFLYLNDDFFLGNHVAPSDFFTDDGKVKVLFERLPAPSGPPIPDETAYRRAWRNTNAFLNARYKKETRYRLCHAPYALRKSLIEMAEQNFSHIFVSNSSHKFRSNDDYNMTNGLLQYYWLYHDLMVTGTLKNKLIDLKGDYFLTFTKKQLQKLLTTRPATFCLEDDMHGESSETVKIIGEFLHQYYPHPAPWEIPH